MKDFISQAAKLLKEHKLHRRQLKIFLCLAVIVAFGTVTALKLYGQAMTHQVEVLVCGYKVHEHTEECYEKDEEGNLGTEPVCGYATYVIHVHNEDCKDRNGNLVCTLEEHEKHEHTDDCYQIDRVLICGLEETKAEDTEGTPDGEAPAAGTEGAPDAAGQPETGDAPAADTEGEAPVTQEEVLTCQTEVHVHDESCYEKVLSCGHEEHAHGDGCTVQELTCGTEEHTHGDECMDEEGNLICALQEHTHGDGCYTTAMNCEMEEHAHDDSCYTSNLTCGKEEHEHAEGCYELVTVPGTVDDGAAEPAEGAVADGTADGSDAGSTEPAEPEGDAENKSGNEGHTHTDECYEEVRTLICGEQELHIHDNSCYAPECFDAEGNLIEGSQVSCGLLQLEEHVHVHTDGEDSCFQTVELTPEEIAALENGATLHIHTEECYDGEGNLICGHDATHIHMPQCYDDAGELICGYGTASHVHEDKCYDEDGNLICGYETASHVHEESCYDADGNLQCGYETATHVHGKECYDEDGDLICGYETATHVHEDSCYDADGNLQCGYGTALKDTVKVDGTFTYEAEDYKLEIRIQADVPSSDSESDVPDEPATDEKNADTDEKTGEEAKDSSEADEPGTENGSAVEPPESEESGEESGNGTEASATEKDSATAPSEAESQPVTDDSAEEPTQEASASGIEELSEVYEGDTDTTVPDAEESQDGSEDMPEGTNSDETEGQPEQDAQILIADEASGLTLKMSSLDAGEEIYAEMASFVEGMDGSKLLDLSVMELHVYQDGKEIDVTNCTVAVNITPKAATAEEMIAAYGEETATEEDAGIIVSALQKTADGVRQSGSVFLTPDMAEVPILQNAVAENGILAIARYVNNSTITKTFQDENFIVTATYKPNANIPAEAELLAEQITEESDSEHYAERQAQYQEALGDETATMRALMKIGFYVEDENGELTKEVEPESPVTITIQFLDEDGLEEGKPITVIHFVEEGTELLEGSKAQDNSTTFKMESFSEVAIAYERENVTIPISEYYEYEDDNFYTVFHIEGKVTLPIDKIENENPDTETAGETDDVAAGEDIEAPKEGEEETSEMDLPGNPELEHDFLVQQLEFSVNPLDQDSEEYAAFAAYVEEGKEEVDLSVLQVMSYTLSYKGQELDLSECTVTALITPTSALLDSAEEYIQTYTAEDGETVENGLAINVYEQTEDGDVSGLDGLYITEDVLAEAESSIASYSVRDIMLDDAEESASEGQEGDTEEVEPGDEEQAADAEETDGAKQEGTPEVEENLPTVTMKVRLASKMFAASATGSRANPSFHVQYYAYLDRLDTSAEPDVYTWKTAWGTTNSRLRNSLIDTTGKALPKNGVTPALKYFTVGADGRITSNEILTKIYEEKTFSFVEAPNRTYFDEITYAKEESDKGSYTLKEIWVTDNESVAAGTDKDAWKKYDPETAKFTNREETYKSDPETYVWIRTDTYIRLVYEVISEDKDVPATFYDYDIGTGGWTENGSVKTLNAISAGINSDSNYSNYIEGGEGVKYAFGNNNAGTKYGKNVWKDSDKNPNLLNAGNRASSGGTDSHLLCTFGLVTGVTEKNNLIFSKNVLAPCVFGDSEDNVAGRSVYNDYKLFFDRKGDTYTLKSVYNEKFGDVASDLDVLKHPQCGSTIHEQIWSNLFWPMDAERNSNSKGHDFMFGENGQQSNQLYDNSYTKDNPHNLPVSDDGENHNCYFGMYYEVTFDLSKDYTGPLEYYFFGDDDMWVFLDGKLVCDIGGVHLVVGEYVNLWDYLGTAYEDGTGKVAEGEAREHKLQFFYTERGASGSTCWMQFTLPSVETKASHIDGQITNNLKVGKTVAGAENKIPEGLEYEFQINFKNSDGPLMNNYSYAKMDSEGNIVEEANDKGIMELQNDVLISDGGTFRLGNGEHIEVHYLPVGTTYTIKETGKVFEKGSDEPLSDEAKGKYEIIVDTGNGMNEGEVVKDVTDPDETPGGLIEVNYINDYGYALPETGGSGAIPYTIAGGIVLVFGAGFLYKKKFRERRDEGDISS